MATGAEGEEGEGVVGAEEVGFKVGGGEEPGGAGVSE